MCCATPLEAPSRHSLHGVDEVRIGRGPVRGAVRRQEQDGRRLVLTLADSRASSAHARLVRREEAWTIEDLGSKNGSFVNGAGTRITELADGDVIQVGQTLLIFRASLPTPARTVLDLEAAGRVPAFSTLLPLLARQLDVLATVAASDISVLLVSETGTGKEVLANAVHALSRRAGDFVPVNCGGLPLTLVESVLFGHKRGAFSGAVADHPGLFRAADRGTLFLDEVGDMPHAVQASVLRALQSGEILPVGTTEPVHADVRIVSATHRDLEARVAEGTFREDLLARLSGFAFHLPPLRERREDIGLLAGVFLARIAKDRGSIPALSPEVGALLVQYDWPRNVRELEKCLAHAAVLAGDDPIEVTHLPPAVAGGTAARRSISPDERLRAQLVGLLGGSGGNVSAAAEALRTSRSQVHRWMKRFGIEPGQFRHRGSSAR